MTGGRQLPTNHDPSEPRSIVTAESVQDEPKVADDTGDDMADPDPDNMEPDDADPVALQSGSGP
ncbi:hypothetical protein [Rhodococcus sp. ACT016]|uniref:hypothetical protein n=1 Tax=Rhodococcus sp. ACT016 TaxID=3134808 RepID=UPI003D275644